MAQTHHFEASSLFNMQDRICLVTGGGTGIGLMASQALAANGAKVYITGRRIEALEQAAKTHSPSNQDTALSKGGRIIPIGPCDVTKKEDLQSLVKTLESLEPHLDLVVCAAGIPGPKASPESKDAAALKDELWNKESVEDWQNTFNTDVTSVYFSTVAFLPLLQKNLGSNGKRNHFGPNVITISSMSGLMRHAQAHFSYNAAKAATAHLTKLMSAEFQKAGVRVNSIAPGYFPSEMTAKSSDDRQKSDLPPEQVASKGHVPAMRGGTDEEMGMTVLFLARNDYVNGVVLNVDGGVLNVVGS
ncbi:putative short chain dehydrogenase reductase family protein [Acrodontium crateriforme]|uniref:Short chain dehydrogenase reductase family protein n=1 Tax=Acrodontium crateriforme TaxID=150365 RepID=A0AAQ3M741_9PEZI|nr:putative short chain dehydrogenase reductase family protein [Acrodontium crateriforme]